MPANFIMVDRATPMLFPPDMRDLVPEDDMVHFVIEAVERLPSEWELVCASYNLKRLFNAKNAI